jgi:hypothetical protein
MIHVPHSTVSFVMKPPNTSFGNACVELLAWGYCVAPGDGIISGLRLRRMVVPKTPTAAERRKPGLERSMRYHRTGFTRASVRDA